MSHFVSRAIFLLSAGALFALSSCSGGSTNFTPISNTASDTPASNVDTQFSVSGRTIYESEVTRSASSTSRQPAAAARVPFYFKGIVYSIQPNGIVLDRNSGRFNNNVLGSQNKAVWMRDLPLIRQSGANVIRVYNVPPPQYDGGNTIDDFLNAAWNNGDHPIYVLMAIQIDAPGTTLLNGGAINDLTGQFRALTAKYGKFPSVIGVSIGNELTNAENSTNPKIWAAVNALAAGAKAGFQAAGEPNKLTFLAEIDNYVIVRNAEANKVAVDVWGLNVYRGRSFTDLFTTYPTLSTKPLVLTEYGASASYDPSVTQTYTFTPGTTDPGSCTPNLGPNPNRTPANVAELPLQGPRSMNGLADLVTTTTKAMHDTFVQNGVVSGGMYFEWADEWYKSNAAADGTSHSASIPGYSGAFPGCAYDEAWFGLNSATPVPPAGTQPDVLQARPSLQALTTVWSAF